MKLRERDNAGYKGEHIRQFIRIVIERGRNITIFSLLELFVAAVKQMLRQNKS